MNKPFKTTADAALACDALFYLANTCDESADEIEKREPTAQCVVSLRERAERARTLREDIGAAHHLRT